MKVAWVTHRDLVSGVGGAEDADRDMVSLTPYDIQVDLLSPGAVTEEVIAEFDKVVVTGLYGFSSREINILARSKARFWVHDTQFSGHWFNGEVERLIVLTPQHAAYEQSKLPSIKASRVVLNPGHMDTTFSHHLLWDGPKQNFALWAHRPEAHKGLDLAATWAKEQDVRLEVLIGRPRDEVLDRMIRAKYFVLLSHIMDPGPRAIIEAQLSGCELIVNESVGYYDEPPERLMARLEDAGRAFWDTVLDDD